MRRLVLFCLGLGAVLGIVLVLIYVDEIKSIFDRERVEVVTEAPAPDVSFVDELTLPSATEQDVKESSPELPSFTLFDFSYALRLHEEMTRLQQLPIDPIHGMGNVVAFQAQNGHAAAQYRVGLSLISFLFHEQDKVMQVRGSWLSQAAQRGDLSAQKLLYYLYINGFGSDEPEPQKAMSWLGSAVAQGDEMAEAEQVFLASQGWGEADAKQGLSDLESIADRHAKSLSQADVVYSARVALGLIYAQGLGAAPRDMGRSLRYLAEAHKMRPQRLLEDLADRVEFLEESADSERSWVEEIRQLSSHAEQREARFFYAWLLTHDLLSDPPEDAETLGEALLQSIAAGHAGASFELATRHFDPWLDELSEGDEARVKEACELYQKALILGHWEAVSSLARCHELMGDVPAAIYTLGSVIGTGHFSDVENLRQLAEIYTDQGQHMDALECYERLVQLNDYASIVKMLEIYHEGDVVNCDLLRVKDLLVRLRYFDPWYADYIGDLFKRKK